MSDPNTPSGQRLEQLPEKRSEQREHRAAQRQRLDELLAEPVPMCLCLIRVLEPEDSDPGAALDAVHDRLAATIRSYDVLVDWDGPIYALGLPTVAEVQNLARRVERLGSQLAEDYDAPGTPRSISVTIGAAIRTPGELGPDLMERAEAALADAARGEAGLVVT